MFAYLDFVVTNDKTAYMCCYGYKTQTTVLTTVHVIISYVFLSHLQRARLFLSVVVNHLINYFFVCFLLFAFRLI